MNWRHARLRQAGATLLAASLLLSAVPAPSFLPSTPTARADVTDSEPAERVQEASRVDTNDTGDRHDGASSVRPRGREAPISLQQLAAQDSEPAGAGGAEPDPGDGPPPERNSSKTARDRQEVADRGNANTRVWPMPAESYTFTQPFGCVPQIAHFYQPGAGCPVDRPVVHTGLDLAAPEGTPFYAAASGWVTESGYDREVGVANTRIIIQHEGRNDGYATEYLHWVASFVDVGDHVEAGQLIGEVGSVGYSTGPHLHFSLIDLDSGEHVDPTRWLPEEPGTEGYRGVTPRRAAMRLPAGTTAGVPEYTDPTPPELPVREEVPESADGGQGRKNGNNRKKDKQREERRNGKSSGKNRQKDTRDVSGKDGKSSEDSVSASETGKNGKPKRERTRKRERNRDGVAETRDASGTDSSGGSRKERRNKNADGNAGNDQKKNNRKNRQDEENTVQQTDTRDKSNKRNGNGNSGGGNGGGKSKNRQKDNTQQVADEAPAPAEDVAPDDQGQPAETDSGRNGKKDDTGADIPDDAGEDRPGVAAESGAEDQASADGNTDDGGKRERKERGRNGEAGDTAGTGDGA